MAVKVEPQFAVQEQPDGSWGLMYQDEMGRWSIINTFHDPVLAVMALQELTKD